MIYADLHIHVGRSTDGKAVKITASKDLTLPNILQTAGEIKGLTLIGIIDAQSVGVRNDFKELLAEGTIKSLSSGGYANKNLVILPGTEVELKVGEGNAHFLAFFPTIEHVENYVKYMQSFVKNWQLSSQKAFLSVEDWIEFVDKTEGVWLPAHAFTPHKGIYGNCCRRLSDVLPEMPRALEIGLSADRNMANCISELDNLQLFSNSDAHSLPNIAREYNSLDLIDSSFFGLKELIFRKSGSILNNYGLPPIIGKYHRTYCLVCEKVVEEEEPQLFCPRCGSRHVVTGVFDRVMSIADRAIGTSDSKYVYQVPLRQIPGIGPKLYKRLLDNFGTEMSVLHEARTEDISRIAGEKIGELIRLSRFGQLSFNPGGGGNFGRVVDILSNVLE